MRKRQNEGVGRRYKQRYDRRLLRNKKACPKAEDRYGRLEFIGWGSKLGISLQSCFSGVKRISCRRSLILKLINA